MWLFALLIVWPLVEIGLFVTLGGWIGLWPTLAVVVGTAFLGFAVIRAEGVRARDDLRRAIETRQSPGGAIADGALKIGAGVLLILPGFLTDILGALLMIPPLRGVLIRAVSRRVGGAGNTPMREQPAARSGADVIDGTWEELPPRDPARPPSGWTRH